MSSLLQVLGVLFALVASGYSLFCIECSSESNSCTGPSKLCPSGSLCGAIYSETKLSGITLSKSYVMSCIPQERCNTGGSGSFQLNTKLKIGITCCNSENCTPTVPTLPKDNSTSNGLICRSCASGDSTWCYTSDTMKCTGDENMCLLQTTKLSGSMSQSTAVRGCATKSICDLGSHSSSTGGVSAEIKFTCTSGSTGLQNGLYLSAVICLFILKLLS